MSRVSDVGNLFMTAGGAGTRQEIFQDACRNHYGDTNSPMIFYGEEFWKASGVVDVILETSKGRPYHDLLRVYGRREQVVEHLKNYRKNQQLPIVTDEQLQSNRRVVKKATTIFSSRLSIPHHLGIEEELKPEEVKRDKPADWKRLAIAAGFAFAGYLFASWRRPA